MVYMYSRYVVAVCLVYVFIVCVPCMYAVYVFYACNLCMQSIHVLYPCILTSAARLEIILASAATFLYLDVLVFILGSTLCILFYGDVGVVCFAVCSVCCCCSRSPEPLQAATCALRVVL